jgi:integrase
MPTKQGYVFASYVSKELRERLIQEAQKNGVSLSTEMKTRLQASVDGENPEEIIAQKAAPQLIDDSKMMAELQAKNAKLEAEIAHLRETFSSQPRNALTGELSEKKIASYIADCKAGAGKFKSRKTGKAIKSRAIGDGGNLELQITNNGNNGVWTSWNFRYNRSRFLDPLTGHPGSKGTRIGLGSYPDTSLHEARAKALKYRGMLQKGKDPKATLDDAKLEANKRRGRAKTASEVADEFYEKKVVPKRITQGRRNKMVGWLKRFIHDPVGSWPIQKVDRNVLLDTCGLRNAWTKTPKTADDARGLISAMFRYAKKRHYYYGEDPAQWKDGLDDVLPKISEIHKVKHHRSLKYKDAPWFMQVLQTFKYAQRHSKWANLEPVPASVFIWLLLSGARTSEALDATWREMDREQMIWNTPLEHLKNGDLYNEDDGPLQRPITPSMGRVLDKMQKLRISQSLDDLVFPSFSHLGNREPLNRSVMTMFLKRTLKLDIDFVTHGNRSTLNDWRRAKKYPKEWFDIQVDHLIGDKVAQAYGPDKLLEERRGMMEHWDKDLSTPPPKPKAAKELKTANVIDLTDKKRRAA